ncbi:MAG: TonB-dependent receptor [Prevotellaceae bacterium]|jgi:TonB-linked SusC/RagA family outer membrane protein|nr:TonB-dependent receptor [Prevotellaceae bacterium]
MQKIFTKRLALLLVFAAVFSIISAQIISVKGTVIDDATGETLIGVSIIEKGSTNGTISDADGTFSMTVQQGAVLQFSYVGYVATERNAAVNMNIRLKLDEKILDEVVAIGYGIAKRKDVTTAISSVSSKDFDTRPIVSAGQAIQGKAAGVQVIQPNGAPGGETVIRVRGTTSMNASSDPLYVVDGVPVENLSFLAPNDIERIDILKDASSAAIYGSRAANGVVIVTTKAGQKGGAKVTLNAQVSTKKASNLIQPLNAADYKELMEEIRPGSSVDMGTEDITNWYNEVYRTGFQQNYQISVSNSTDKINYFLSAGYLNEKGILPAAFFKRYNFRANFGGEVRKWLNINANISYSDNSNNGITTGLGSNRGGVVLALVNLPTSMPVKNATTGYYNRLFYGQNISNPVEAMENGKDDVTRENRLIASGNVLITFYKGLTLKSTFTLDRRQGLQTSFSPVIHVSGIDEYGSAWDNRNTNTVLTWDNILAYQNTFGKHAIEAMLGSSWTDSKYSNSWINGSNFRSNDIKTLNVANKISWEGIGTGASTWGIMSYFQRVSYNYDSKYLITVNARADGSSRLHPDHRWDIFPSFSAAWRISAENFMKEIKWIDDLKLRGGWGQTGNQSGLGDYAYLQRYELAIVNWWATRIKDGTTDVIEYYNDLAVPVIAPSNLRTTDLTWEKTSQSGIGVDFTLLKNRLTVVMDYYYKKTTKMLLNITLPEGANASSIQRNGGLMVNQGFELSVNSVNIRKKDFEWQTDFKFSLNRNKLVELDLTKIYYDAQTSDAFHGSQIVRNEEGHSLGGFYGYISDGVDTETGELIYRDLNDDHKITATDRTYIGDPNPDFIYGMTNTFTWKGLSINIFLQGTYGNDIFNASRIETEGMNDLKNQSIRTLDRWKRPGMETTIPKAGYNILPSSYFIEDGSYLRIKDITVSYNIVNKALRKAGITRLQPYFTVQNLLTFTKYIGIDPEVNQWGNSSSVQGIDWGTYPHARAYVFGINVEF